MALPNRGDTVTVKAGRRQELAWAEGYAGKVVSIPRQRFRARVVDSETRLRTVWLTEADIV